MKYNIDGKYPMMANWLSVKVEDGVYCVTNILTDEIYELDKQTYRFLRNLNGNRNPYKVARKLGVDAEELLDFFDENLFIRTEGRKWTDSEGTIFYTVYIPVKHRTKSIIPKVYNFALCVGWLPMLLYGIYLFLFTGINTTSDYMLLGYIVGALVGAVVGIVLHEMSHAMACLAYGGEFFEAGVLREKSYPGAYVLIDTFDISSPLIQVQINLAGAEMNILLLGLFFVFSVIVDGMGIFFFSAAIINGLLAISNIVFIDGLDGCSVIGELIGLSNGVDGAKRFLRNEWTGSIKEASENKIITMVSCIIIILYQILLPLFFINNVLYILGAFL